MEHLLPKYLFYRKLERKLFNNRVSDIKKIVRKKKQIFLKFNLKKISQINRSTRFLNNNTDNFIITIDCEFTLAFADIKNFTILVSPYEAA